MCRPRAVDPPLPRGHRCTPSLVDHGRGGQISVSRPWTLRQGGMYRRFDPWNNDWLIPGLVVIMLVVLGLWLLQPQFARPLDRPKPPPSAEGYLFSTWNVENLFDDQDDPRNHDDEEDWFGRNPEAVHQKVALLTRALLAQNGGRGPDILALVEVENR